MHIHSARRKYINILSMIGMLIIIGIGFISYLQIKQLTSAASWVIRSHEVIEVTDDAVINMTFAESAQRGFLLTSNNDYLTSVDDYVHQAKQSTILLQQLTRDNPTQHAKATELGSLLKARMDQLLYVLKVGKEQGVKASLVIIAQGKGTTLSNQIRHLGMTIIEQERKLLFERTINTYQNVYRVTMLAFIGDGLSLGIILIGFLLLNHQLTIRIRAEETIRESEEKLQRLAFYDVLTGLPNRTKIMMDIDNYILEQQNDDSSIAFLLIDIDHFKNINESMSHEVGDDLIRSFAAHLKQIVREYDMIAHLGSDEFVVVLSDVETTKNIVVVAQKILQSLAEPLTVDNKKIYVTVSIGISIYPNNGIDAKSLLKNADIAVYRAKELGRNNYQFCTPEMILEVEERASLDYYLHQALKYEEFILLYQPKISLKNDKLVGVEVLMRWNRPAVGLIFPDHFISLAESNGLIVPIGEWMLRTACMQGKQWQLAGLPEFTIAINVSTRQLVISDFVHSVKTILRETGFNPQLLELEITESVLMENSINNLAALNELKDMGIKITIDDFGTGYSSLSYLRLFAIDRLKIDKSFIEEIRSPDQNISIINAIIVMAHSLGIQVVAEGVETPVQVEYLKKTHCDEAQGFYYSHPIPALELQSFLFKSNLFI